MTYTTIDAAVLKPAPGPHPAASPHHNSIGQALGVRAFGLYQVELPPGGTTARHDHIDDEPRTCTPSCTGLARSSWTASRCPCGPGSSSR